MTVSYLGDSSLLSGLSRGFWDSEYFLAASNAPVIVVSAKTMVQTKIELLKNYKDETKNHLPPLFTIEQEYKD